MGESIKKIFLKPSSILSLLQKVGCCLLLFFLASSCENDLEKINAINSKGKFPTMSGKSSEIVFTDSAKIKLTIKAPEVLQYTFVEAPYTEFPKGIEVTIYDSLEAVEAIITSKYAIYQETKDLWIARSNVVAKNVKKGDRLETEELFWDMGKKRIYSEKFTKITTDEGTLYGESGFVSREDLKNWKLISGKGTVTVEDE